MIFMSCLYMIILRYDGYQKKKNLLNFYIWYMKKFKKKLYKPFNKLISFHRVQTWIKIDLSKNKKNVKDMK